MANYRPLDHYHPPQRQHALNGLQTLNQEDMPAVYRVAFHAGEY